MMGFSMFFPSENDTVFDPYLSSSSVDCTLSLGTPSTRLSNDHHDHDRRRFSTPNSNNTSSWDFLHSGKKSGGGGETALAARRCTNCDTTSTPLWRNGPRGPKSLCNACGIRFKKEERRKTAGGGSTVAGVPTADYHGGANYYNNHYASSTPPWIHQHHYQQNTQRVPYYSPAENEYSFVDDVRDDDHDVTPDPFLSWRLNVADRTSFVHDFTM